MTSCSDVESYERKTENLRGWNSKLYQCGNVDDANKYFTIVRDNTYLESSIIELYSHFMPLLS